MMKRIGSEITTLQREASSEIGMQLGEHGLAMPSSFAAKVPPATPQLSKSLSQPELASHREKIASSVKIVLSAYFQPHEAEEIRAGQLAWWCDELQDWTQEQVVYSLRKWNRENPDKRPTPGHIVAIMKELRGRKIASQLPKQEPKPERVILTAEEAAELSEKYGYKVKKFGGD